MAPSPTGLLHIGSVRTFLFNWLFARPKGGATQAPPPSLLIAPASLLANWRAEIERFAFYEKAKEAYAVIVTGETRFYGCFILKKGVIPPKG